MRWPHVVGVLYFVIWMLLAWASLATSVLLSMGIPVILSILTTVTDEGAESGSASFRGNAVMHRACVNIHWGLTAFYLSIIRGILFPSIAPALKEGAWGLLFVSILFGVIGAFTIRKQGYVPPIVAILSSIFVLAFGSRIVL